MRFFFALLLPAVFAGTFDVLMDDLTALEGVMADDAALMQLEEDIVKIEASEELFPLGDDEVDPVAQRRERERERRVERRDAGEEELVTAMVDGQMTTFFDVPARQWFAPYVREIAERGIISGYRDTEGNPKGEYGPGNPVRVEELAKIAIGIAGIDQKMCSPVPRNVSAVGRWSQSHTACAEDADFVLFSDAAVSVARLASRGEVVVTVLQALTVSPGDRTGTIFRDVTLAAQFASFIERAARDGVVSGYADQAGVPTGLFGPDDPINRAEIAKILVRAIEVYR